MVITGTRVIYPSNVNTVTVKMTNEGKVPSLVQSWIDSGNANDNPATAHSPFLITPPIVRVNPGEGQELRIMYTGQGLPTDRETIYWLNVLDIPPKAPNSTGNQVSLAIRSRLKLFYRPSSLKQPTTADYQNIIFSGAGRKVNIKNNTAYYISISGLNISGDTNFSPALIPPFGSDEKTAKSDVKKGSKISYSIIDDYGATKDFNTFVN